MLQDLKYPPEKEKKLDVFISHDMKPQYHGALSLKQHCLLGLPATFNWKTDEEFENGKHSLIKKNFPWEHPQADRVKAALMLTDEEKEFVIARQLGYLDNRNVYARLVQRFGCLGVAFFVAHAVNMKYGFYNRRIHTTATNTVIVTIFGMFAIIGCGLLVFMDDAYTCYLDRLADKYAGTASKQYAAAGVSYYNKLLESNKALRDIIPGAEKKFTVYGNEMVGIFRTKTIPIMQRRDYLARLVVEDQKSSAVKDKEEKS